MVNTPKPTLIINNNNNNKNNKNNKNNNTPERIYQSNHNQWKFCIHPFTEQKPIKYGRIGVDLDERRRKNI